MNEMNNRQRADEAAARQAAGKLAGADMALRCGILGLSPPAGNGGVRIAVLGRELILAPPEYGAMMADTGKPAHPVDRILALHYLLGEAPVRPSGELISFRDLPGGQMYWEPFRSRTVIPLERHIGNRLELLRERLDRLSWEPVQMGDLGASIRGAGNLPVTLVYRAGDEEFPPAAEIFFDSNIRRIYCTEDAAALAGRICMELIRR